MNNAKIVDSDADNSAVGIGKTVTIAYVADDETEEYKISILNFYSSKIQKQ